MNNRLGTALQSALKPMLIPEQEGYVNRQYGLLVLMAASLPLSRAMVSVSLGLLAANFFLSPGVGSRIARSIHYPGLLVFLAFPLVYMLGLFYSSNLATGLDNFVRKLPFIVLPMVMAGFPLTNRQLNRLLDIFVAAVMVNVSIAAAVYIFTHHQPTFDVRQISLFFSHIRLALMILFAMTITGYRAYHLQTARRWFYMAAGLLLGTSLLLVQSLTGLVIAFVLGFSVVIVLTFRLENAIARFVLLIAGLTVFLLVSSYLSHAWMRFHTTHPEDLAKLDTFTVNGNPYLHDTTNLIRENGYYVGLYLAPDELEEEWNSRSSLPFKGHDKDGQVLAGTLKRYLTAKGLRKDSAGIAALSHHDIYLIEAGVANPVYADADFLYARIYQILWELEMYRLTGYVRGHSVAQRIEFLLSGWHVIRENPWFGVGTGDVMSAQRKAFQDREVALAPEYQRKSHNQWVTLGMALGMVGLLVFVVAIAFPVIRNKTYRYFLFNLFLGSILLSFLSDDTLDTHIGVNFFCFFYALFVFTSTAQSDDKIGS
ncbi:MAG: O-antigen ligase family protein [Bacteroidales bacterium]